MSDEIRAFTITGDAAKAYTGGTKKRRTAKRKGGDESISLPSAAVPAAAPMLVPITHKPVTTLPAQTVQPPVTVKRENAPPVPERPVIIDGGDSKKIKVELKKKQSIKKVQLHQKKDEPAKIPVKKSVTKKNRKVLLGVSSLHRRMTRAKKMQKKAKEMPLDKLKEELIQKKLIKATSKAPESVLRQIAADAQIVEGKAL
jgi:hypothetical protein